MKKYQFRIIRTPLADGPPGMQIALVSRTEVVEVFEAATGVVVRNHLSFRTDVRHQTIEGAWRYLAVPAHMGRGNAPRWWRQFMMDGHNARTVGL